MFINMRIHGIYLFLLIFLWPCKKAICQVVCIDSTFNKSLYVQGKTFTSSGERIATADNGILAFIRVTDFLNPQVGIAKFTASGSVQWSKSFTPTMSNQNLGLKNIIQLKDGNFILGGSMYDQSDIPANYLVLIKMDMMGNILWQKKYKNHYGSSVAEILRLRNIQEGLNGDILVLTEDNNAMHSKAIFTRLSPDGSIVWSNSYFGSFVFTGGSTHIVDRNNHINIWGIYYTGNTGCFLSGENLLNIQLDYATGNLVNSNRYCIAAGKEKIPLVIDHNVPRNLVTQKLSNGNSIVFLYFDATEKYFLINLFDENMIFIKSVIVHPPGFDDPLSPMPTYSYDANNNTGEIVFNFNLRQSVFPYSVMPYNFFVFLDDNLTLQRELFVQNSSNDTMQGSARFLQNGQINFIATGRQTINPQYGQMNYSNTIAGAGTDAFCNAKDSLYGKLGPHGLVYAGNDFQFDSVKRNVYALNGNEVLTTSSFNILETTNCKIISVCGALKINGPAAICLSNDTVHYSVYKNPQCLKKIKWQIDTSIAKIITTTDTSLQLTFKKQGRFKLYALLQGCVLKDSLQINISQAKTFFALDKDSLLCPGKSSALKASTGFAGYLWQNGSKADSLNITQPGFYKVIATDSCGNIFKDSIQVNMIDTSFRLPAREQICSTDTFSIKVPKQATDITWQPSTNGMFKNGSLKFFPERNTAYNVAVSFAPQCSIQKKIDITVEPCPETIFFPNSFTPNNDGKNDFFKPSVSRPLGYYHFGIYNRYGQKVFETSNPQKGWDGTINGARQNTGSFIWQCSYAFANKAIVKQKGYVLLLR